MNFDILFPNLDYSNQKEYEGHCHFLFTHPQDCLHYIQNKMSTLHSQNTFALEQCKDSPSKDCCKSNAKSNDLAYQLCIQQQQQPFMTTSSSSSSNHYSYAILLLLLLLLFLLFSFFFFHNK